MPWAGVLSYLVPGLGQIAQGRVAKGVLFLVCVYTLFFYGMYHGSGSIALPGPDGGNVTYTVSGPVYLPGSEAGGGLNLGTLAINLYNRPQFLGQFWVGVVAWPALWQYFRDDKAQLLAQIDKLRREVDSGLDPEAVTEQKREQLQKLEAQFAERKEKGDPLLGHFQEAPSDAAVNAIGNAGDKRLELAWVYTVIAGVLNIMVIYDAVAGPAFLQAARSGEDKGEPKAA
jgi:hypothetical protein